MKLKRNRLAHTYMNRLTKRSPLSIGGRPDGHPGVWLDAYGYKEGIRILKLDP